MRRIVLLGLIIFIALVNALSANDKYVIYTQTFPWIGPDGEAPEVVFVDLIEQERLVAVYSHNFHVFWFDGCEWQNEIGKLMKDLEYKIKVFRDVPNNDKKYFAIIPPNRDPTTIIVDINGTGNYTSIQEGINNSVNGDTVIVYPGTYYENINYNGKNITVASLYIATQERSYIDSTVIDGNQNGSVVTLESNEDTTAVLCGFTIQNGSGTYYLHNYHGGGLLCKNAHPTISYCNIENNCAEQGGGISCVSSHIYLKGTIIKNNYAEYNGGGLLFWNNSNANFYVNERCNIFLNYGSNSCDLHSINCDNINITVDTFTVSEPDNYFSYPVDYFTFNILNSKIEPINQDLYVSPAGDNTNSGLTQGDPLKNIAYALTKIASDSTHPNTIHLANGIYSPNMTGEIFPLNCRSYVSIIGENEENTILDGNSLSNLIACVFGDNHFSIENLTIQHGSSTVGSAISFNTNSSPTIKNMTIKDTDPASDIVVHCRENSNPLFENVTIKDNNIELTPIRFYNCNPMLVNCIIKNNTTSTYAGASGGITSTNSHPIIINCLFIDNEANDCIWGFGGGFWVGDAEIINVTVCNNYANTEGGGIYSAMDNILVNSILYNNTNNQIYVPDNAELTISYSNIQNGYSGIAGSGTVNWLDGNMDEDPLFVGGDPFSYELTKYSPCIDAGTPDTTGLNLPATDLAGNQRIFNGRIDIGAYEYQGYDIDEPDTSFIHNLYLFQNTPNPFKRSTTISFISADYERIKDYTLSIYNTKGQLVRRYIGNEENFWVKTEIEWDGTDEYGKQVAPGTYLYKLEYNGNAVVRKMVRLR